MGGTTNTVNYNKPSMDPMEAMMQMKMFDSIMGQMGGRQQSFPQHLAGGFMGMSSRQAPFLY